MKKRIAILGAGISGLALAWFLQKRFGSSLDITLFEANDRVGGWLHTERQNGALFECGPRSLRASCPELSELINDVGLTDQLIYASNFAKTRYIVHQGKLEALPNSLRSLFSSKLGRKILFACLREPFAARANTHDETVASFFERRIGKKATATFISALTAGIFAARPEELSMRSAFHALWEKEAQHGSLIKAALFSKRRPKACSFTFRDGIGSLPKAIGCQLKATILLNQQVTKIEEKQDEVLVQSARFDHLFSTICPEHFANLLAPFDSSLCIPTTSLVTVSVAAKEANSVPAGFGFLCPEAEDPILLGVVFDSSLFPELNGAYKTRLSFMMGGSKAPNMLDFSDDVLLAYTHEFAEKYLLITKPFDEYLIKRAPSAIARLPVGHFRTLQQLEEQSRRITLLGSGLYGVSVGESVASACKIARNF